MGCIWRQNYWGWFSSAILRPAHMREWRVCRGTCPVGGHLSRGPVVGVRDANDSRQHHYSQ